MLRTAHAVFTLTLISSVAVFAQKGANLSGTWITDPARSESAHQATPVGPITLVISQTPKEIIIETRTDAKDKSSVANEKLTYRLDGSENTMVGASGESVVCKARWDGLDLIADTVRNLNDSTVTTHWVLRISETGNEITIRKTLTVQHGYQAQGASNNVGTGTDIFVRSGTAGKK
jgi:hypothetical protein